MTGIYFLDKFGHPEIYQGQNKKNGYFEGWYFKQVSADRTRAISIIPGVALSRTDPHSFIQIIDGYSGRTEYFRFSLGEFSAARDKFRVTIGKNDFSTDRLSLDMDNGASKVKGTLSFKDQALIRTSLLFPGIMGWYAYVPFMECYHGLVSMDHSVEGTLVWDKDTFNLSAGRGYIEKDWGRSFPKAWIWMQANTFQEKGVSVMISVAIIPWLGSRFTGCTAFIRINGEPRFFATWNGTRIMKAESDSNRSEIILERGTEKLIVTARRKKAGMLRAPVTGSMDRRIAESLDSDLNVELSGRSGKIYSGTACCAGFEAVGELRI